MIEYIAVAVATFIATTIIAVTYAVALLLLRLAGKVNNALRTNGRIFKTHIRLLWRTTLKRFSYITRHACYILYNIQSKKVSMQITEEQYIRILEVWEKCKSGKCETHEDKAELITIYNEIHNTKYKTTTNCGSCLRSVFVGIKHIVEKWQYPNIT
jgi:hypothetical protein|tara:strand:+ start:307 stop:774 length:468 start_codon:yes stop_codon:yes gene_type:complete